MNSKSNFFTLLTKTLEVINKKNKKQFYNFNFIFDYSINFGCYYYLFNSTIIVFTGREREYKQI